mmetsp:Transcript_111433/g.192688  ORF Transcript_111433/g.192688 Transcript_111433/m.192688 type:complete len:229 (+) Transcript_111433:688-1374(+)
MRAAFELSGLFNKSLNLCRHDFSLTGVSAGASSSRKSEESCSEKTVLQNFLGGLLWPNARVSSNARPLHLLSRRSNTRSEISGGTSLGFMLRPELDLLKWLPDIISDGFNLCRACGGGGNAPTLFSVCKSKKVGTSRNSKKDPPPASVLQSAAHNISLAISSEISNALLLFRSLAVKCAVMSACGSPINSLSPTNTLHSCSTCRIVRERSSRNSPISILPDLSSSQNA